MKIISYIILTCNSDKYIKNCLDSVYKTCGFSHHVIVIDNGSTDNTNQILKQYKATRPNLDIFNLERNYGTTYPRNMALKAILEKQSDYICVLDSDTVLNGKAIKLMVNMLDTDPKKGIVGPKLISAKSREAQPSGRNIPTATIKFLKGVPIKKLQAIGEDMETPIQSGEAYPVGYLMSACWIGRADVFRKVGFFDEKFFYAPEDVDYCIRVWKAGYKVVYCGEVNIIHIWQRISKKKLISRHNLEQIKGLIYLFVKHKYCFSNKKVVPYFNLIEKR